MNEVHAAITVFVVFCMCARLITYHFVVVVLVCEFLLLLLISHFWEFVNAPLLYMVMFCVMCVISIAS